APQITPGKRAVSIPVTEVTGVSKLIKPGDRVDLIAVLDQGGGKENRIAKTIFQDLVVLSIGKNVTNNVARIVEFDQYSGKEKVKSLSEDTTFTSISVEVEPVQAQALALVLANNENTIYVSLRNNDDADRVGMGAVGVSDVTGGEFAPAGRGPATKR
ncbi:MAG: Flp pilus assembly protein CpaB, partial [Deltaproteobacteria bacterium]|nr:Flp pilus assembly protein CpaB [Deltaproteobacteria bacterium]